MHNFSISLCSIDINSACMCLYVFHFEYVRSPLLKVNSIDYIFLAITDKSQLWEKIFTIH